MYVETINQTKELISDGRRNITYRGSKTRPLYEFQLARLLSHKGEERSRAPFQEQEMQFNETNIYIEIDIVCVCERIICKAYPKMSLTRLNHKGGSGSSCKLVLWRAKHTDTVG